MSLIKRRKNETQQQSETEQIKDLIIDIEGVKKAIEACIDFEQATKIHLIDQRGRIEFSKIYKKKERENKVRELVIDTVRDEVKRQISPIDSKLNQLLRLTTEQEISKIDKKANKKVDPTDEEIDQITDDEIDRVINK